MYNVYIDTDTFDKGVKQICKNPFAFVIKHKKVRCKFIKKFPYGIFYKIDKENKTVIVIAVFNTNRNPKIWKKRI